MKPIPSKHCDKCGTLRNPAIEVCQCKKAEIIDELYINSKCAKAIKKLNKRIDFLEFRMKRDKMNYRNALFELTVKKNKEIEKMNDDLKTVAKEYNKLLRKVYMNKDSLNPLSELSE